MLFALPLFALPVIIHLIHRRKHSTVHWGAMMFLIEATRASRGWQRIRHFLILLFRMLAVAGLIFAISRPIAGGWLGLAGGGPADCVIVVLDRSASMGVRDLRGGTKLSQGIDKLVDAFKTVEANHWVLIDSIVGAPRELDSPEDLRDLPIGNATATSSDMPSLLQAAVEYREVNKVGRTEIWVLSDTQSHDWRNESSQWGGIRDQLMESEQVRVLLLSYAEQPAENASVRVTRVQRTVDDEGAALTIDLVLHRAQSDSRETIPVEFMLGSARSVIDVPVTAGETRVDGHKIPLDEATTGWGKVSIPDDGNESDNTFYFTFGAEPTRRTLVVAENMPIARILGLVAHAPRDPTLQYELEAQNIEGAAQVDLDSIALILWQGTLPQGDTLDDIERFVDSGGRVIFFPPINPGTESAFGSKWTQWNRQDGVPKWRVDSWFEKGDLLRHTEAGRALPVGELSITEACLLEGDGTTLARLETGKPLLSRAVTTSGGVYFCTSLPRATSSNFVSNAVVFYVMVQRALEDAVGRLRGHRQQSPGRFDPGNDWSLVSEALEGILSSDRHLHASVFSRTTESSEVEHVAINRSVEEDTSAPVPSESIDLLFEGLDFVRVDETLGGRGSVLEEVWRVFLIGMIIALVAEAILCLFDVQGGRRS